MSRWRVPRPCLKPNCLLSFSGAALFLTGCGFDSSGSNEAGTGGGGGGSASATVGFTVATSTSVDESAATQLITVSLTTTAALTAQLTAQVDVTGGTATAGADFTDPGSVAIVFTVGSANGATRSVSLAVLADAAAEANETVIVTLSNAVGGVLGAQTTHTFTITDDDVPPLPNEPRINTIAGDGTGGFGGDGGPATAAQLFSPNGIAVDGNDNIFFADFNNARIRRIDAATGIITTVAGDGTVGGSGNGGPALAAQFSRPSGVALDALGNLYIADRNNHAVRRVDAITQVITRMAGTGIKGFSGDGGLAMACTLEFPTRVRIDSAGNLIIADTQNHRIRRVDVHTGIISTVAGSGTTGPVGGGFSGDGGPATAAELNDAFDVALDADDNLFIADRDNHRIRRVDAVTGIITTVAGTIQGFFGDGGLATAAQLDSPRAVTVDRTGSIFISDRNNERLRRVDAAGMIATVAGTGTAGFFGDGGDPSLAETNGAEGVTVDSAGMVLLCDSGNNRIRRVTGLLPIAVQASTLPFGPLGSSFNQKVSASQGSGAGYTWTLLSGSLPGGLTLSSGTPEATISGTPTGAGTSNFTLSVTDSVGSSAPLGFSIQTGAPTINTLAGNGSPGNGPDGGQSTLAQLAFPASVSVDQDQNVLIADFQNARIRQIDAAGVITTVAGDGTFAFGGDGGAATSAQMSFPRRVTVDGVGNFFIADTDNHVIRRVDARSGIITTVAGNATSGFSGDGGAATAAQLAGPKGVTVDAIGNIYIADTDNELIRRVEALTGIITTIAGTQGVSGSSGDGGAATAAQLNSVRQVATDAGGDLFLTGGNSCVRRIAMATGIITTVAGQNANPGPAVDGGAATADQLDVPRGLAFDPHGNMLIADTNNARIRIVDGATGIITTIAGTSPGFAGDGGAATSAQLLAPKGVVMDRNGRLYIADSFNHRLRVTGP